MQHEPIPSFYENEVLVGDLSLQKRIASYPVGKNSRPVYGATVVLLNPNRSPPKFGGSPLEVRDTFIEIEFSEQAVISHYRNLPAHRVYYAVEELENFVIDYDFYKAKLVLGGLIYNPHVEKNEQLISRVKDQIDGANGPFTTYPRLVVAYQKYMKIKPIEQFIKTHIGMEGFEEAVFEARIKIQEILDDNNIILNLKKNNSIPKQNNP